VARSDLYIAADLETDGPSPGSYSMLSFGLLLRRVKSDRIE
jgi:hypothetical protein